METGRKAYVVGLEVEVAFVQALWEAAWGVRCAG